MRVGGVEAVICEFGERIENGAISGVLSVHEADRAFTTPHQIEVERHAAAVVRTRGIGRNGVARCLNVRAPVIAREVYRTLAPARREANVVINADMLVAHELRAADVSRRIDPDHQAAAVLTRIGRVVVADLPADHQELSDNAEIGTAPVAACRVSDQVRVDQPHASRAGDLISDGDATAALDRGVARHRGVNQCE